MRCVCVAFVAVAGRRYAYTVCTYYRLGCDLPGYGYFPHALRWLTAPRKPRKGRPRPAKQSNAKLSITCETPRLRAAAPSGFSPDHLIT